MRCGGATVAVAACACDTLLLIDDARMGSGSASLRVKFMEACGRMGRCVSFVARVCSLVYNCMLLPRLQAFRRWPCPSVQFFKTGTLHVGAGACRAFKRERCMTFAGLNTSSFTVAYSHSYINSGLFNSQKFSRFSSH